MLAGGIALGAFEAGAYAALDEAGQAHALAWIAGSSVGGVAAAIIAGNPPENRVARLRQFWRMAASDPTPVTSFWFGPPRDGAWRQAHNQASVLETLMLGRTGLFRPRLHPGPRAGVNDVSALYDLAPLFAPVEVDGRLLGDGGLSSNAPLDIVLTDPAAKGLRCFVVDLFAREGSRPHTLAASASRAGDLAFGNQSRRLLEAQGREDRLRTLISQLGSLLPPELRNDREVEAILSEGRPHPADIVYISYRAKLDEAGLGKVFDFSCVTINDRWEAGKQRMQAALGASAPQACQGAEPGHEPGTVHLAASSQGSPLTSAATEGTSGS